jgi:hypothetical protein
MTKNTASGYERVLESETDKRFFLLISLKSGKDIRPGLTDANLAKSLTFFVTDGETE